MSRYLAIAIAVLLLALGGVGYLLKLSYEDNGKLKESNAQLQASLKAKSDATRGRAQTDDTVRKLPPADVIKRLQ